MRRFVKVLAPLAGMIAVLLVNGPTSFAAVLGNDGPGGTVTVGASTGGSSGPVAGGPGLAAAAGGTGSGSDPWTCTSVELVLNNEGGIAPGGPTPGAWYSVTCSNGATGSSVTQTEWITGQTAPAAPAVDPRALALDAERSLELPSPTMYFNPSGSSVVNLPTWLWIDGAIWHSYTVTATAGTVTATAVATPMSVTWTMGDGIVVSCGRGVPFDPIKSASRQTTSCDHVYRISSLGQPSPDGNPDDGAFTVSATVSWSVQWTAQGAPGGGSLPALTTSSQTRLRVEQVQSVFTESFVADSGHPLAPGRAL